MARNYGDGSNSHIGTQLTEFYYQRKALIEQRKTQYFGQLGDTTNLPKHMGKTLKRYLYLPLLDDRNINDQGIDADGAADILSRTIEVRKPNSSGAAGQNSTAEELSLYFTAEGANNTISAAVLLTNLQRQVYAWAVKSKDLGGAGLTSANLLADSDGNAAANYTEISTTGDESAYDLGYRFTVHDAVPRHGNLYGSSKDVGTIAGKLPALGENGGRVNRVGFRRVHLEGSINKFGFFDEYSKESMDFDTDAQLMEHVNREMLNGAGEMTEDALQIDLLNSAGVVVLGGEATATNEITGANGATASVIDYADLQRLDIELTNNRCPKQTTIQTGTRLVDTQTIPGARYMYIGSEMQTVIEDMVDQHSRPAFISAEKYAAGTRLATGEIGMIGKFRVILVPEMMHWAGAGAAEGTNDGYRATGGNYDVYPMLVVGDASFQTIGFQTSGQSTKFTIYHKKPGLATADKSDPYGEQGFMSIKWYYGFMVLRPERIAVCKSVAPF